jgi:TatD DNase family protein
MKLFDSHAHITSAELAPHAREILQRARAVGVDRVVNICTDTDSLNKGLEIATSEEGFFNVGSTTPHDVEKDGENDFPYFAAAARAKKLVAIGETGLDYHYQRADRKVQQKFLVRYLHLAAELQLPVIFHCREAFDDLFSIVDQEYPKGAPAILHCFTGTQSEAEGVLQRGWHLSMSGIVTFKKSEELRAIAKEIPIDQLLIETDAPYLAPQGMRGKLNEPAFLIETAACLANVRGISLEEVAFVTRQNGLRLFASE